MVIRGLSSQACLDLLKRIHLGRLAYAKANQPYVLPIGFAYHQDSLYCATTVGQKIEWMRENPLVAIEVDEIKNAQHWESVIVSGQYEELADTPEMRDMRQLAWSLLQEANRLWWEPGYVRTIIGGAERPMVPVFFRIRIGRMTGHRATNESVRPRSAERSTESPTRSMSTRSTTTRSFSRPRASPGRPRPGRSSSRMPRS